MRCANASELYRAMCSDIESTKRQRSVADPMSPTAGKTMVEAAFGRAYVLTTPKYNLVDCLNTDLRWAIANVLHFFADTEEAEVLLKYNRHAARFLDSSGTKWDGAYGAIAMPQIVDCVSRLQDDKHTRRAIVSMGEADVLTINRPACWSFLHFLSDGHNRLDLLCYQRSCAMAVMPYDLVLLANILNVVSNQANMECGELHWHHGSLHRLTSNEHTVGLRVRHSGITLPVPVLVNSTQCFDYLLHPESYGDEFAKILAQPNEVRT